MYFNSLVGKCLKDTRKKLKGAKTAPTHANAWLVKAFEYALYGAIWLAEGCMMTYMLGCWILNETEYSCCNFVVWSTSYCFAAVCSLTVAFPPPILYWCPTRLSCTSSLTLYVSAWLETWCWIHQFSTNAWSHVCLTRIRSTRNIANNFLNSSKYSGPSILQLFLLRPLYYKTMEFGLMVWILGKIEALF